jgi:hypothetical protein
MPIYREPEDIRHMAFNCLVAKYICKKVFKEWWARTTDCLWVMHPTLKSCFFSKGDNTLEIAKKMLNDIAGMLDVSEEKVAQSSDIQSSSSKSTC